jgi:hypothetical protein
LKLTSKDYVYYSRETAELRREIFENLQDELPQTGRIQLNRERLLQRVQNAFQIRPSLPSGTPDLEHGSSSPSAGDDVGIELPLQDSVPLEPLTLKQPHGVEAVLPDCILGSNSEGLNEIGYWNSLQSVEDGAAAGLNELLSGDMDFDLVLSDSGTFGNDFPLGEQLEQYADVLTASEAAAGSVRSTSGEI